MAFTDLNDQVIQQVRDAADIVDFIQQVTPLKLAGARYKGLCPFHREKTPSFTVDRSKGLFYCFGCGTGGDVFKFLALTERFTFPEAVEHVAARYGIELPKRKRTSREADKDDLYEVMDDASEAFHQALQWTPNAAEDYLRDRGVAKEIVTKYGFGFAPESWDYILRRLGQKHGEQRLEKAGLVTARKEKSGFYDRFRNRLIIPIHSDTGALVGFGGRSLDGSEPKYLNSPESELFNKSRLLYNLHRSKDAMRRIDRAILVEGYFDAIAIDHVGVPGVVASMGTSLTAGQASLLRRFTRRVVICYDGDDAGRAATLRAAEVLLAGGLEVLVLDLLGDKDPDTLVQKHGADRFLELLSNAGDVFTFALKEWATDVAGLSGRDKSERVGQFVGLLGAVPDPVVRNDAAQRIADAFHLEFETIWSRVRGKAQTATYERQVSAPSASAEKFVLTAALQGRVSRERLEGLKEDHFEDPGCKTIFSITKTDLLAGNPIDFGEITTHLKGEAEITLLSELTLSEDVDESGLARIDENLRALERSHANRCLRLLQRDIQEAQKAGDELRMDELWQQKRQWLQVLDTLK